MPTTYPWSVYQSKDYYPIGGNGDRIGAFTHRADAIHQAIHSTAHSNGNNLWIERVDIPPGQATMADLIVIRGSARQKFPQLLMPGLSAPRPHYLLEQIQIPFPITKEYNTVAKYGYDFRHEFGLYARQTVAYVQDLTRARITRHSTLNWELFLADPDKAPESLADYIYNQMNDPTNTDKNRTLRDVLTTPIPSQSQHAFIQLQRRIQQSPNIDIDTTVPHTFTLD